MANRPFSTFLIELFYKHPKSEKKLDETDSQSNTGKNSEPTPISFEPCLTGNAGILSMFVQLPGRTNLAIGSALIELSDKDEADSL